MPTDPAPVRVQRKRTQGWKMPANTVYVGRPTKWGNPFVGASAMKNYTDMTAQDVWVGFARRLSSAVPLSRADVRRELRGKNLACFCPLDQPCHADVLLEIANAD